MPSQQSSFTNNLVRAFAGLVSDTGPYNARSYHSEEASAEMPFGVMLARGSTDEDEGALLPHTSAAAMANAFIGVLVHSHGYGTTEELGDTGVKPAMSLSVMTHGRVWVPVEEAVDPGDAVRVRVVTAGMEVAGHFRTTADASDCVDISAFARFLTSTTGAGLALVEIDMTSPLGTAD